MSLIGRRSVGVLVKASISNFHVSSPSNSVISTLVGLRLWYSQSLGAPQRIRWRRYGVRLALAVGAAVVAPYVASRARHS